MSCTPRRTTPCRCRGATWLWRSAASPTPSTSKRRPPVTELRSKSGRVLTPLEHDLIATFHITRGPFTIPAALPEDDADEHELRVLFARSLPDRVPGATLDTQRRVLKDGSAVVAWRRIEVRMRRAPSAGG